MASMMGGMMGSSIFTGMHDGIFTVVRSLTDLLDLHLGDTQHLGTFCVWHGTKTTFGCRKITNGIRPHDAM
jgi:hypothetical protein